MPQIDPVVLRLEADLRKYQTDLGNAQKLTDQKLDAIESRGMLMGQNLKKGFNLAQGAALGFIAKLGYDEIKQAAQAGLEYASSLGETAQQLGVTTSALQEYRYAASQAGLSQEEMDLALTQLTRRIGEAASGTKAQAQAFNTLGVSVKDANGNILTAGDAIPKIADALEKVKSPAERAAILMDLFGKSGQKLEPLLSGGSKAVNELRAAAHELGLVLSEDQIQRADETADKLAALNQVLSAQIAGAVANNAQSIYGLASALTALTANALKFIDTYPRLTSALAGAAIGGRLGGGYGAALGAGAGVLVGGQIDQQKADSNMDLRFRTQQLKNATAQYRRLATAQKNGSGSLFALRNGPGGGATPQSAKAELQRQQALMAQAMLPTPATASASGIGALPAASGGGAKGASGPSAAEIANRAAQDEARYQDELGRIRIERLRSEADYTESTQQRYEAVVAALDEELASYTRQVETDDGLTAAKRQRLLAEKTAAIDAERANAEQDRQREIAAKASELGIAELQAQADILDAKAGLATGAKDRLRFELELFDLHDRIRRAELDRILATEATSSAQWQRAKIERDALDASRADRRTGVARDNATPLQAYRDKLQATQDDLDGEAEKLIVSELEHIRGSMRGALSDLIGTDDPLLNGLIDLLIQNIVIKPLADALAGASGGGGGIGGFVASIGSAIFGRASGGRVNAGQMVRVNEGASPGRVEGFIPQGSGHIVPLGRMNALKSGGGGRVFNITVDARNSVTPDGFARDLSSQILSQAQAMDGQTAKAVLNAIPGRMNQMQRDGY